MIGVRTRPADGIGKFLIPIVLGAMSHPIRPGKARATTIARRGDCSTRQVVEMETEEWEISTAADTDLPRLATEPSQTEIDTPADNKMTIAGSL